MRPFEIRTLRFVFAGGMTACLYFLIFYVLLDLGLSGWLAALVAYMHAFIAGYTAQKYFTFRSTADHSVSLPRYASLQIVCAAVAAFSAVGAEMIGVTHPLAISFATTVFLGIVTYLVSVKWVF
jgi:putative flippase GtrA